MEHSFQTKPDTLSAWNHGDTIALVKKHNLIERGVVTAEQVQKLLDLPLDQTASQEQAETNWRILEAEYPGIQPSHRMVE